MSQDLPLIDSRAAWQAALRWGFETALQRGARRITCVDASFETWPLDDPALLQDLTAWLRLPLRRLVLLARRYDEVPRRFPRFTAWRRDFGHAIEPWQAPEELASDLPNLLLDDGPVGVQPRRRLALARPRCGGCALSHAVA
ncbi:MAG: hypothetical protein IPI51_22290 [Betaproteobacteria bacterium]|nr:hypothetical protein [Betaproteobacteria bacterium]